MQKSLIRSVELQAAKHARGSTTTAGGKKKHLESMRESAQLQGVPSSWLIVQLKLN